MKVLQKFVALSALTLIGACASIEPGQVSVADARDPSLRFVPGAGYERFFSPQPHNFQHGLPERGDPVRLGETSERFELRDGDCGGGDCFNPRARAEIQMPDDINPSRIGKDIWYGWSFYNDNIPSFTKENSLRLIFGQWTVGRQQRPIFRLIQLGTGEGNFDICDPRVCSETPVSRGDIVVQLDDIATQEQWGDVQNDGYICRLFDMTEQRGKWVDLTVHANFSTRADGYLKIWVNGQLACDYEGPLVSAASASVSNIPRHRRGIFSSWDKRWRTATGNAPKPDLIVHYDEFRAGSSWEDVDVRLREANAKADGL